MIIGIWNVRKLNNGNLEVVQREMENTDADLLGISEMKWKVMGHFTLDDIYYCGQKTLTRNGVVFICNNKLRRCVMGFNPVNDRIFTNCIQV